MEDLQDSVLFCSSHRKIPLEKKWGITDGVTLNCGEPHVLLEKKHKQEVPGLCKSNSASKEKYSWHLLFYAA